MARLARIVAPGIPHFITQRGNRGAAVFACEDDADFYLRTLAAQAAASGLAVWAYCLLPDRVHFLAVPGAADSLRAALGETHRRHTNRVNQRRGETGHLWQSRFASFPLAEDFVLPAAQFIEMSPVMAGLCRAPERFRWSSARAHMRGEADILCDPAPLLSRAPDWAEFLRRGINTGTAQKLAAHMRTGRPLGGRDFIGGIESQTGRALHKKKPGRKRGGGAQAGNF